MRRLELFFLVIRVPLDFLAIFGAALAAYFLRFGTIYADIRPATQIISFSNYVLIAILVSAIWVGLLAASGLYSRQGYKFFEEVFKITVSISTGFALVVFFLFFQREFFASRFILLAGWILAIVFVAISHAGLRATIRILHRRGLRLRRAIIIGSGRSAQILKQTFDAHPEFGIKIAATLHSHIDFDPRSSNIDEIIYAADTWDEAVFESLARVAEDKHLTFKYAADFYNGSRASIEVTALSGIPLVELKKTPLEGWGALSKRIVDILLSFFLLVLLSPPLLLIALAVKLTSAGPVIFRNIRVGQYGGEFETLKFRTMYAERSIGPQFPNSEKNLEVERELIVRQGIKNGPVYKIKNDPRVTPVGKFLRRTSLDELPQLWNVLRGEMSLVGPRPHQPREVEQYSREQKKIFLIKPGITGLAQISGRSDLSFDEESRLDLYYMEHWSHSLDLTILLRTLAAVLRKKGAY